MDLSLANFLQIDFPALLVASLAGLCCGLPGNFLVLRKQSLIGDAMSHVVLPGIVVGYLVSGTLDTIPMLLGALGAALISALLIEIIRRLGNVEPGAAMGVVFTSMFALGVLILEQTGASGVHLDVEHAPSMATLNPHSGLALTPGQTSFQLRAWPKCPTALAAWVWLLL